MSQKRKFPETEAALGLIQLFEAYRDRVADVLASDGSKCSMLYLRVLMCCYLSPGMNQQAVVDQLRREKTQIARIIRDLESSELLIRRANSTDRRSFNLEVTTAGRKECERYQEIQARIAGECFGTIDKDDMRIFLKVIEKAYQSVGQVV
jgi:DNA-binding MarR family transcriptional regulator